MLTFAPDDEKAKCNYRNADGSFLKAHVRVSVRRASLRPQCDPRHRGSLANGDRWSGDVSLRGTAPNRALLRSRDDSGVQTLDHSGDTARKETGIVLSLSTMGIVLFC